MKHIFLISLFILGLWGCQDDKNSFDISISQEALSFEPIAGGAVMRYKLPYHGDIMSIRVRYRDAFGQEILRTGSYASDSLHLVGFNEAQEGVQAHVSLCNRNKIESEPTETTFNTKDSGPIAFFNELEVTPGWDGFTLTYNAPKNATGMAHIFYVGEDPRTHEPDTLLVNSFIIEQGADTLQFRLQQSLPKNTVVVRTEDFRGYMVKQKVWENVEAYNTGKLEPTRFDFLDPLELSQEDTKTLLSKDYLFDGETKGETCFGLDAVTFGTYLAGPNCIGKTLFILDLREPKQISEARVYSVLNIRRTFNGLYGGKYENKLPCDITIYASNDKDDENSWEKIGRLEQARNLAINLRWCSEGFGLASKQLTTLDQIKAAKPCYASIHAAVSSNSYRYLKVVVNEIFNRRYASGDDNLDKYVTFHEFEVYTKKD